MTYTDPLAYFLLSAIFGFFALIIAKKISFYKTLCEDTAHSRFECIDGLRGFLALGVFFTHSVVIYYYYLRGVWIIPPSSFYTILGELSVALFFMITAFLFWSKVLTSETPISAASLFVSRNKRLTPMYLFSVSLVLAIVAVKTGFELKVTPRELLFQVVPWFSYGLLGIPRLPDINGLKDTHTIESVYWTLTFEWEFYLLLPLLARLPFRTASLVSLMILFAILIPDAFVILNFAFGAIAAHLFHKYGADKRLKSRICDGVMLLLLALLFMHFDRGHGFFQYLLGFAFFVLILQNNNIFGLLVSRPAKLLGSISYSTYLLHNITLYVIFNILNRYNDISNLSPLAFWCLVGISGLFAIAAAALTYRFIEYPFLAKKQK